MNVKREKERQAQESGARESIGEMLTTLASNSAALVRDEILLAKQEMREKATEARTGAIVLILGAALLLLGAGALCAAAVLGLALYLQAWLAALVVGGLLAIVGALLAFSGIGRIRRIGLKPEQALEGLEDIKNG